MPPDMLFKKRCFVFYFCKVKMQKKRKEEEEEEEKGDSALVVGML